MTQLTQKKMQAIIEAALMIVGHPLTIVSLQNLIPLKKTASSSAVIKTIPAYSKGPASRDEKERVSTT